MEFKNLYERTHKDGREIYQDEIWQECNNRCEFCYLYKENEETPMEQKINALKDLNKTLDNFDIKKYGTIAFIGGEFFQGQLSTPILKELFMSAVKKAKDLLYSDKIEAVWIFCTLTIGDQKDLYDVLDLFKDHPLIPRSSAGVWICTSWDTKGRFHTKKMKDNWEFHMDKIYKNYPNIKRNTTVILTEWLLDSFNEDKFSFSEFSNRFNTALFFKQPCTLVSLDKDDPLQAATPELTYLNRKKFANTVFPGLFPPRHKFIKFLFKMIEEEPEFYEKMFNIKFRADILVKNYNNGYKEPSIREKDKNVEHSTALVWTMDHECGHIAEYRGYCDGNECMICDRDHVLDATVSDINHEDLFGEKE